MKSDLSVLKCSILKFIFEFSSFIARYEIIFWEKPNLPSKKKIEKPSNFYAIFICFVILVTATKKFSL